MNGGMTSIIFASIDLTILPAARDVPVLPTSTPRSRGRPAFSASYIEHIKKYSEECNGIVEPKQMMLCLDGNRDRSVTFPTYTRVHKKLKNSARKEKMHILVPFCRL